MGLPYQKRRASARNGCNSQSSSSTDPVAYAMMEGRQPQGQQKRRMGRDGLCHSGGSGNRSAAPAGPRYLSHGRVEEASGVVDRLLDLCRPHTGHGWQAQALRLCGEVARHRAPPDAAACYRQALALAEELGMRPLQAHCHRGLGLLYAVTGQPEPARRALSTALEMYRAMDMTFWLPQTEAALAQVDA